MSVEQSRKEDKLPHRTNLYVNLPSTLWPIVYSPDYNITFLGLEKLHPFDSGKWGKIVNFLKEEMLIKDETIVRAIEAQEDDLLVVHSKRYLNKLKWSFIVATITEILPVAFLPNFIIQRKVLRPFRTQTGGTIMAGKLAIERGWAINVGGGFHHCSSDQGGGFCIYADITLAIKFLFERVEGVSKAMIIDLDAHQGNGHERDFMDDNRVYIMDVFNRYIYPGDGFAKPPSRQLQLKYPGQALGTLSHLPRADNPVHFRENGNSEKNVHALRGIASSAGQICACPRRSQCFPTESICPIHLPVKWLTVVY
ncbi:histone deacetylase 11 isoform X2 [Narcine bancroftii]|uniref:histone deacetylase 11 isoform X2 n=1 Tax=Narcine bancroftii TaxID=1343680 RepID=UPI0038310006